MVPRVYAAFLLTSILGASPSLAANITAVWANEGGDKVTQDELRASHESENLTGKVHNQVWDGKTISLFGGRNEIISFNLVLEAPNAAAGGVSVEFNSLLGNSAIASVSPTTKNGVFNWVDRPIELFYVRYLAIHNLSTWNGYDLHNEVDVPVRFRQVNGGGWTSRPDHDKAYPDILVPLELVPRFNIAAGQNQSIWADIYIPKGTKPGLYSGTVVVKEGGVTTWSVPVQMTVFNFSLPDAPFTKTIMNEQPIDRSYRYFGGYVNWKTPEGVHLKEIGDTYTRFFHRHRMDVSQVGEECVPTPGNFLCDLDIARQNGSLFTVENGYDGPGVQTPQQSMFLFAYGIWNRAGATVQSVQQIADTAVSWFDHNMPNTFYAWYLVDEPSGTDLANLTYWSNWIKSSTGPGHRMPTLATVSANWAEQNAPGLDIPVYGAGASAGYCLNGTDTCDVRSDTEKIINHYKSTPGKHLWAYNTFRPYSGGSVTEDDGTALREIAWSQYKLGIEEWFYWDVDLYGANNLFQQAITWGSCAPDTSLGQTGCDNGNGTLIYPGTDVHNLSDSYGVDGPFASIRLKEWRRGIEDADYLTLASKIDPAGTQALVNKIIPMVLWEYPAPVTYYRADNSWSSDPDVWEAARYQLAKVLDTSTANNSALTSTADAAPPLQPRVFPNPWKKGVNSAPHITVDQIGPGAEVRIFTVSGHLVTKLMSDSQGRAVWTFGNDASTASGLYLYSVRDAKGRVASGKFAIIR